MRMGLYIRTGSGPRHFAWHPNRPWVFTINELSATITTFSWDPASGALTEKGSVPTRPAGVTGGTTAEIAVHPNGRFVYGSNRGHAGVSAARTLRGGVEDSDGSPRRRSGSFIGRGVIVTQQSVGRAVPAKVA